jgi:hypothetical protein
MYGLPDDKDITRVLPMPLGRSSSGVRVLCTSNTSLTVCLGTHQVAIHNRRRCREV